MPGVPDVDIVSVYAQLAEDGATFLVVAATVYPLGRLLVVPAVRWGLARSGIDWTAQSALGSVTHLLVIGVTLVAAAQAAGFRGALAGSTLVAAGVTVRDVAHELDYVVATPEPVVGVSELGATAVLVVGRVWIPNERRNRLPGGSVRVRPAGQRGVSGGGYRPQRDDPPRRDGRRGRPRARRARGL